MDNLPLGGWVQPDEQDPEEPPVGDILLRFVAIAGVIALVLIAGFIAF